MLDIVCPQVFDLAIQWFPSGGTTLASSENAPIAVRGCECRVRWRVQQRDSHVQTLPAAPFPPQERHPLGGRGPEPGPGASPPRHACRASTDAARGSASSDAAPEAPWRLTVTGSVLH